MVGGLVRCSTTVLRQQQQERKRKRKKTKMLIKRQGSGCLDPSSSSVHQWFTGKSFFLRGGSKDSYGEFSYLCKLPGSWLEKSFIKKLKKKKPKGKLLLAASFNHNLRHEDDQPQFALPQTQRLRYQHIFGNARTDPSAWAALGSTIYIFGGYEKERSGSRNIYCMQTADVSPVRDHRCLKKAGCMVNRIYNAKVVALDGKIYIFGGQIKYGGDDVVEVWAEVFEPQPNSHLGQCRALSSPPSYSAYVHVAVAVEKERKIIVGWGSTDNIYEYDVARNSWVKFEVNDPVWFSLTIRSPCCQPLAVGNVLYWLDKLLVAYDLDKKLLFMGPIEDLLLQLTLENPDTPFDPEDFHVSLVHLAGDFFCVVWVERNMPQILHFTMIRVLKTNSVLGRGYNLRASVLSCQTVVSHFPPELQDCVLMI